MLTLGVGLEPGVDEDAQRRTRRRGSRLRNLPRRRLSGRWLLGRDRRAEGSGQASQQQSTWLHQNPPERAGGGSVFCMQKVRDILYNSRWPTPNCRHAPDACGLRLPVAARPGGAARAAEPRHRTERQRQVEPLSRAAAARRDRAGSRHPVARARRRACSRRCGRGPEAFSRAVLRGEQPVAGHGAAGSRSACVSGSPATTSATRSISACRRRELARSRTIRRSSASASGPAPVLRPSALLVDRRGPLVKARDDEGEWVDRHRSSLPTFDSMMTHCADPRNTPEMLMLREQMRAWRFYDQFRTDAGAPGAPAADRHAHAGAQPRRLRSRRGAADDRARSATARRSTRRSMTRFPVRASR